MRCLFVVALLKIDEQFPHAPKTPTSGGKNRRSAEAPWHVEMLPSAPFCSSPGEAGGKAALGLLFALSASSRHMHRLVRKVTAHHY